MVESSLVSLMFCPKSVGVVVVWNQLENLSKLKPTCETYVPVPNTVLRSMYSGVPYTHVDDENGDDDDVVIIAPPVIFT